MYLNESLVPDLGVQGPHMLGQVHVQHQRVAHLVQRVQTRRVTGLVELGDDVTQLGLQLQKLFEGAAKRASVEGGESHLTTFLLRD